MTLVINADQADYWNSRPGQQWVTFDADLEALHGAVTRLLLEAATPQEGESVIDIGCGAGATTFRFADQIGQDGHVIGVDISEPLISVADQRKTEQGIANASFIVADAQTHVFEPSSHDLAVSRFGVMFFSDPVAAFRNIRGSLKPGGRIVFAAWAGPEANPWFSVPQALAVERLGPISPEPSEAPGPLAFRDTARVTGILREAGFADVAVTENALDLHHPGGLEAVLRVVPHVGPIARMMKEKNGTREDRDAILDRVGAAFQNYEAPDGVRIPARVNVISAHT